jgi:hypothetical protein
VELAHFLAMTSVAYLYKEVMKKLSDFDGGFPDGKEAKSVASGRESCYHACYE